MFPRPSSDVTHIPGGEARAARTQRSRRLCPLSGFQIRICERRQRRRRRQSPGRCPAPSPAAPGSPERAPPAACGARGECPRRARGACGARCPALFPGPGLARAAGKGEAALCAQAAGPGWASAGRRVLRLPRDSRLGGAEAPPATHTHPGCEGGNGRAEGEGARGCDERRLCTRRRPCTSRSPSPASGRGARCAAAGGGRASPLPRAGEVLEVRGRGPEPRDPLPGLSSASPGVLLCVDEAGSRGPGFRGFTHTHLWPCPAPLQPPGPGLPSAPTNWFLCFAGFC